MGYLQLCSLNWKLKMVSFKEQISDTFWWIKSSCSAVWFVCSRMYSSQFLLRIHNLWVQYPVMSQPRFHGLYLGFGVPLLHCGIFSLDNAYSLSTISIPFHHFLRYLPNQPALNMWKKQQVPICETSMSLNVCPLSPSLQGATQCASPAQLTWLKCQ